MKDKKSKLLNVLGIGLIVVLLVAVIVTGIILNGKKDRVDQLPDDMIEYIIK